MNEIKFKIEEYLEPEEIKQIVKEQFANNLKTWMNADDNFNYVCFLMAKEEIKQILDEMIPDYRNLIASKIQELLSEEYCFTYYGIFSDGTVAKQILDEIIINHKQKIKEEVEAILFNRISLETEIWKKFELLGENFISTIYDIAEIGRKKAEENS